MTRFRTLSVVTLFGLATLAGCSAFNGDSDRDRDRDRDRDGVSRSGDVPREAGAARRVPRDAKVVDEGRGGGGNSLSFTARDAGTVYLEDSTAGVVVWDQKVREGDRISVTPGANRIEVNNKETRLDLKKDHRFQLYYLDTDRSRSDDRDRNRDRR